MFPRSMLSAMQGAEMVESFPLSGSFSKVEIWLAWRKGFMHPNVSALLQLLSPDLPQSDAGDPLGTATA
jgi:DNA-binding transcriptional LysR family regulator